MNKVIDILGEEIHPKDFVVTIVPTWKFIGIFLVTNVREKSISGVRITGDSTDKNRHFISRKRTLLNNYYKIKSRKEVLDYFNLTEEHINNILHGRPVK